MFNDKRKKQCKEIAAGYQKTGICTILGKGKTADAICNYLRNNANINNFNYIVEDRYTIVEEEKLSNFLKKVKKDSFVVYGFSDTDKAMLLDVEVFSKYNIKTFFLSFPFSFNETGKFIDNYYFQHNINLFNKTREMLDDDSQSLFDTYISAVICGNQDELMKHRHSVREQYFDQKYIPDNMITMLDVGAYIGDTLEIALKKLKINKYYAFEPDEQNLKKLKAKIKDKAIVKVYETGVYFEDTTLSFNSAGSSSGIVNNGDSSITVIKLDSIIEEFDDDNIFLKMDIEGMEINALKGAQNLIAKKNVFIAVCVYHCIDDLITIPQYIESIKPDYYSYGLRYYGNNYRELVLYAKPKHL